MDHQNLHELEPWIFLDLCGGESFRPSLSRYLHFHTGMKVMAFTWGKELNPENLEGEALVGDLRNIAFLGIFQWSNDPGRKLPPPSSLQADMTKDFWPLIKELVEKWVEALKQGNLY